MAVSSEAPARSLISLAEIEADEAYWPRLALSQVRVREFAALYREQVAAMGTDEEHGAVLPPLLITRWKNDDKRYILLDGWHRYHAAQEVSITGLLVEFSDAADEAEAFDVALARTAFSALPLSPRERRRNIVALLVEENPLSHTEIARRCGASRQTVISVQRRLEAGEDEQAVIHGHAGGNRVTGEDDFTKATRALATAVTQVQTARRGFLGTRIGSKSNTKAAEAVAQMLYQQHGKDAPDLLREITGLLAEAQQHIAAMAGS